jgi:hypothetical protein
MDANSYLDYKCRQCGQRFSLVSEHDTPERALANAIVGNELLDIHTCSSTLVGIADLIGARPPANQKVNDA